MFKCWIRSNNGGWISNWKFWLKQQAHFSRCNISVSGRKANFSNDRILKAPLLKMTRPKWNQLLCKTWKGQFACSSQTIWLDRQCQGFSILHKYKNITSRTWPPPKTLTKDPHIIRFHIKWLTCDKTKAESLSLIRFALEASLKV